MISYEDFLSLKEEKLKLERDNLRLKNEISQLAELKEHILPMKLNLIEKYKEQEQEKDTKIMALEATVSSFRKQMMNKNKVNEKNDHLIQKNQKLKEEICLLRAQYKLKEEEFSQKSKQNEIEIQNLKQLLSNLPQKRSQNENEEMIEMNDQLNSTVQMLSRKYKTLKIKSKVRIVELTQQNEGKDAEIRSLKEQINKIKSNSESLSLNKEGEIDDQYKKLFTQSQSFLDMKETKIKSLENEISKLKIEKAQFDSNNLNEINQLNRQIQELNQKNQSFISQINELTQKNNENELKIKSLEEEKNNLIKTKDANKQGQIIDTYNEKKIKEANYKSFESNSVEINNQIYKSENHYQLYQQIKDSKSENSNNHSNSQAIESTQEKDMKIKNAQNQSNDQNLSKNHQKSNTNKTLIKRLENTIKKQKNDIENKVKLISKLKIIVNMNQNKINRMETEIVGLNNQLQIYQKNNEQITDYIQSYKKQNMELIKIAFDSIQKSNYSVKSEIYSILLDWSEKIEDDNKKNSFINELKAEISNLNNNNNNQNDSNNNSISKDANNELLIIKEKYINLKNKNSKLKDKVRKSNEENNKNQSIIAQLNEEIKRKNKAINKLNNQISLLSSKKDDENI